MVITEYKIRQLVCNLKREILILMVNLLSRDQEDFMASLLNALLGASDADVGAGVVGTRNSDLGSSLKLKLLQLLTVLANDEAMVLLRDGNCG